MISWARRAAMFGAALAAGVALGAPKAAVAQGVTEAAAASARYRIELRLRWTAETHPYAFPGNPHFSSLVGAVHNGRYSLFRDGDTASSGLALVATNGRPAVLRAELMEAMRRRRVSQAVAGPSLAGGEGVIAAEFMATAAHDRVSVATMLAPSPDWITGVADVALRRNGAWIDRVTAPLWVWDAGADSGPDYRSKNQETQPRQSVRLAATPHFLGPEGLRGVGVAVITRLE